MDIDAGKVEIEPLSSPDDCAALAATLAHVWGFSQSTAVASPDTLKAMAHSGCYVVGVRSRGLLIGRGFGWPTRLGASVLSFHHDFYGELKDAFSAGLGSDRFLVRWGLDDSPVTADSTARELILDLGADGSPVVNQSTASRVAARIPANIVDMRAADKPGALEWRDAFAATVGTELEAGSRVVAMTADLGYLIDR